MTHLGKTLIGVCAAIAMGCGGKKDKDQPPAGSGSPTTTAGSSAAPGSAAPGSAAPAKPDAKPPAGDADPELKKLTDDFAACKDKNTTCPAYAALEAHMKKAADDKKKHANFDAMMACVDAGPVERVHACAYAGWAFSGWAYEAPKDPAYGQRLLAALRALKTDEPSYAGSSVGQFLASWLVTEDGALRTALAAAMTDKKVEKRGRGELFRLCNNKCLETKELNAAVTGTAQDATESEDLRIAAIRTLAWAAGDSAKAAEALLLTTMADAAAPKVSRAALESLASMGAVDSYPKVIDAIKAHQSETDWIPTSGMALTAYFRKPLAIEHKPGVDVALAVLADTKVTGWYRSYYVGALGYANDKRVDAALAKYAKDKDTNISKAAATAIETRKKAADAKKPK